MAIVVTGRDDDLARLLGAWDGVVTAPVSLEVELRRPEEPDLGIAIGRVASAALADLADVPHLLGSGAALGSRAADLARRLGWTVRTLRDWEARADASGLLLEATLASAAQWDDGGAFWRTFGHLLRERPFVRALRLVLGRRTVQTAALEDARAYEREALKAFELAELAGDWVRLAHAVRSFGVPVADVGAGQAALGLAHLDWRALVGLADATRGWAAAWLLTGALPLVKACRLATASTSGHVRFSVLERVLARTPRELDASEELAFSQFLISLSKDAGTWPAWLAILNDRPVLAPHVQAAIGRALSRCGDGALEDYVSSVPMDSHDGEVRDCLTVALRTFRSRAPAARRLALWRLCHERWVRWDFGAKGGEGLVGVAACSLDYGVVGWIVERSGWMAEDPEAVFARELRDLERRWHSSLSAAISGFFRIVSRHRLLGHARSCLPRGDDWLPGGPVRVPAAADQFVRARYGWSDVQ